MAISTHNAHIYRPDYTNFSLSAGGEYLALVSPGGEIVHQYAPEYPSQRTDYSYGLGQAVSALREGRAAGSFFAARITRITTMNILVAGATGKTGIRVTEQLREQGHTPIALVRDSSDTSALASDVVLRKGDLTNLTADACEGCDAVIFAAGSGGSTGPEMTDKVDRDGAKDLVDIAAKAGISRFVMLSSVGADNPDPDSELAHYLQAKHEADVHLQNSGLEYAILRPVALTDDVGNRNMIFGDSVDVKAKAARGDVAAALVDAVTDPEWKNRALLMQSA